jgi:DNA-binding response OmpR family regulator
MIKKPETGPASARTILLVDDSPKEKHIRANTLNTHGYDVDSVSNIDDAIVTRKRNAPTWCFSL